MSNVRLIQHEYAGSMCQLRIPLPGKGEHGAADSGRHVQNVRNSDVYVEDYHFLIYLDVQLYKFCSKRRLDTKDLKHLNMKYDSKDRLLQLELPCLPLSEQELSVSKEIASPDECPETPEARLDLWKLKRITDCCRVQIDNSIEPLALQANFGYGFASKYGGRVRHFDCDLPKVVRIPEPAAMSPLQRSIDRDIDELKDFSRDQYKLNFVELQVPEGHDNPMHFSINFKECSLSRDEECLLHNLTCKPENIEMPDDYDQLEVDCGLLSILLAICYDIRSTSNEPTCESGWTRSALSATLSYFEQFDSVRETVISFMRRSLIYPLYRNYDLSRQCIQDAIVVLQSHPRWLMKQLLVTHQLFLSNDRGVLNHYYIEDYIRYVSNRAVCPEAHLQTLAQNLKNILLDVCKKHLGLGLIELETELLKELITDIHINGSASDDESDQDVVDAEDDDDNVGTESCESDFYASPESESEENSVIEQRMGDWKL